MNSKTKIILGILLATTLFLAGRYSKPVEVRTEIKEVVKTEVVKEKAVDTHKSTTIVDSPDGTKTTHIDENTETKETTDLNRTKDKDRTETVKNSTGLVIGPLIGLSTRDIRQPIFGGYIDKQVFSIIHLSVVGLGGPSIGVAGAVGVGFEF